MIIQKNLAKDGRGIKMVKFVMKLYVTVKAKHGLFCDDCNVPIKKNVEYKKLNGKEFHRLCKLCFIQNSLDAISEHINSIRA